MSTNYKANKQRKYLLFLFGPNKAWPWSYVSLYRI